MFTTLLFAPGDSERKMTKACASGADLVIFDLEDSVAATKKQEAREVTAQMLQKREADGPLLYVRVNPFDSGFTQEDVAAVLPAAPDGIVLPKACGREDLQRLDELLGGHEIPARQGKTRVILIATETAASVLALAGPPLTHPRLTGIMWGAEDLAADLGAGVNYVDGNYTEPFRFARTLCLMAASAAGVTAIDTIYADFKDEAGLRRHAAEACRDGFGAKAAIHPAQLPVIAEAFRPDEAVVAWARKVVAAFADNAAGVASLDGKMLDKPHLVMAEKILARL